ncbi:MAG: cyclase family protein, partial [Halothece sp. Uz-M2-17]|nr:cyclase family protein [Halothece sp. Uz-M2-17]
MNEYIDVSVPLSPDLPVWPGAPKVSFQRLLDIENGDIANDTNISLNVHTGTHVDAPFHFVSSGYTVEQMPLDILMGAATVVDVSDVETITVDVLENLALSADTKRLLFRTRNSQLWEQANHTFDENFVALTAQAAQWIADQGIRLVGVDYMSVQRFHDGPETHLNLLKAEVTVIESLNLANVSAGEYELICLPMKLAGVEGAPARVILRPLS